jgi:hypothetical protein
VHSESDVAAARLAADGSPWTPFAPTVTKLESSFRIATHTSRTCGVAWRQKYCSRRDR